MTIWPTEKFLQPVKKWKQKRKEKLWGKIKVKADQAETAYQQGLRLIREAAPFLGRRCFEESFDRRFIREFLEENRALIGGDVLEFGGNCHYCDDFPCQKRVIFSYVGDKERYPDADFYGDLMDEKLLPAQKFDCIFCTQVLMYMDHLETAVAHLKKMLKPGGHLLVTVNGPVYVDRPGNYSSFFSKKWLEARLVKVFGADGVKSCEGRGNFDYAVRSLLQLRSDAQKVENDDNYPVIITAVCHNMKG